MLIRFVTLLLLFFCCSPAAWAQRQYRVDDFSKAYFGKIYLADTAEVFSPGWVAIYDKKTRKQVLKVTSDELALFTHNGKAESNVLELPYGEQSLIISNDFNFDGRLDLALQDGQNSCYHGPSFQVYLGTATGFVPSPAFTALAQEYCGMFSTDAKAKRLSVMTKSGCCWHEWSEFIVRNNKPFLVRRVTDQMTQYPFSEHSEEVWNGSRYVVTANTRQIILDSPDIRIICSFQVADSDKQVMLFTTDDTRLYYALLRKDDTVEFVFPGLDVDPTEVPFALRRTGPDVSLEFFNGPAAYVISETAAGTMTVTARSGAKTAC
ncbi:XAC2610-related protein [Hymenobacter lucidus]|uniref:VCBS repeat-containing protein n=1 Tax=Hymenobacter lucidus TaxID=2880930 RepID=A0ABS8ARW1_9BACT|nr:hypothetical protein [Hymenobacter lucidus]MCB2408144.1 hypothetical protein [Hymenobacter lucidus]